MSATKIGKNITNISKLLFVTINFHFITSNQISTYRKLILALISSTCLEMQMTLKKNNVCHASFYFVWKKPTHKSLKVAAAKSLFSSVFVIGATCLDDCFSFYVIAKRHYFSWKFIVPLRLFWAPFCYFLWDQYFERALHFMRYLHNKNMMLMPKFQDKDDWLCF